MNSAELIRLARHRRGLTQTALAKRLGTFQSAIARWERGNVSPRVETLERILAACGFRAATELRDDRTTDLNQIRERLEWTPAERLNYLKDMLAFEERARRARPIGRTHMLEDVPRILALSPEERLLEVRNLSRFESAARRV